MFKFTLLLVLSINLKLSYCYIAECLTLNNAHNEHLERLYDWNYINFTWNSFGDYLEAFSKGRYIPENNAIVGLKYYNDRLYLALPIAKEGAPVTLAWVDQIPSTHTMLNPLLNPFPSWSMNVGTSCSTLQNVQSMEIDRKGYMWVLDGRRIDSIRRKCPPKIIILDLKSEGRIVQSYDLPEHICKTEGCFLNDIVLDEIDSGYAYVSETSESDPGIIVYSKGLNRAWKVRDKTMYAQDDALNFTVSGITHTQRTPIDGIALSPMTCLDDPNRRVYYTALVGLNIYSISTRVLRNEKVASSANVGKYIRDEGRKQGPSDGLMMDSNGVLYYGLLTEDAIARWDTHRPLSTAEIVERNSDLIKWPDSFGFDTFGTLYLIANNIDYFMNRHLDVNFVNFRLLRYYTGTCSYQF